MHSSFWPWLKRQTGAVLAFAGLTLAVYGYQLPSLVYAGVLKHHHQTASDWVMLALMVIPGAAEIYALSRLYRRRLRQNNPLHIQRRPFHGRDWGEIFGLYALILAVEIVISQFGLPENQVAINQTRTSWPLMTFFMSALFAPLIEELVFRGLFMTYFWRQDDRRHNCWAVITSALVFGLIHEPRLSWFLVTYTTMGLGMAFLYRQKRDLRYAFALHFTINALPSLIWILPH
ncbi:CPBP family intramembrane glutamic endopeptidase [Lacticaseibacillus salsurivasis]|uniref:CPBP family intramembrane glutamic endopeptidase n=1 Tax=Lacticaseibacillus salsurivasis TaxID=3081441 RepID=UPI0030C668D6